MRFNKTHLIGKTNVGLGHRPFYIAELSANHNQSKQAALDLVVAAAEAGADAIKLQTYTPETLTINCSKKEFYIDDPESVWNGRKLWDLYTEAYTPWEWHEDIFKLARKLKLYCISSVFDESSVDFLMSLKVDALKIASFEAIHIPLLHYTAKTQLPVIVSTGMASLGEIQKIIEVFVAAKNPRLSLLKCTSSYPALPEDANIKTIDRMRKTFGCVIGLSDHCLEPHAAYAATALGASIIEKHITLNRHTSGVDSAFSIEPHEFSDMVAQCNKIHIALGKASFAKNSAESTSRKERPSIFLATNVEAGEKIQRSDLKIRRPAIGLKPEYFEHVIGLTASRTLQREDALTEQDLVETVRLDQVKQ